METTNNTIYQGVHEHIRRVVNEVIDNSVRGPVHAVAHRMTYSVVREATFITTYDGIAEALFEANIRYHQKV